MIGKYLTLPKLVEKGCGGCERKWNDTAGAPSIQSTEQRMGLED